MTRKSLLLAVLVGALLWAGIYFVVGWFWTVMAVWAAVALLFGALGYRRIKKWDDGFSDIDWDKAFDDTCSEVARQNPSVVTPIRTADANYNAFMLDDDTQPKRAS